MASVAAGVTAYDTVYPDIKNVDGLRAEANDARRMGYGGKIAIHPDQVAIIHEVFTPSAQEIDWARRVIATFENNPASGVLTLDGKMLDKPHLVLARRLLAARADEGRTRSLLPTLDRLFAGPRESILTIDEFLEGLESRSYAFAIAALDLPELHPDRNSLAVDDHRRADGAAGGAVLPRPHGAVAAGVVGRRGLPRGKLQDFLARARRYIERLENADPPAPRMVGQRACRGAACMSPGALNIVIWPCRSRSTICSPAWAILFFCLALHRR